MAVNFPPAISNDISGAIRYAADRSIGMCYVDIPIMEAFEALVPNRRMRLTLAAAARYMGNQDTTKYVYVDILGSSCELSFRFQSSQHTILLPTNVFIPAIMGVEFTRTLEPVVSHALQWANLRESYSFLQKWLTKPEQFNYFAPWLRAVMLQIKKENPKYAWGSLTALLEGKSPRDIPAMPRDLLDVCRSGSQLFAQHFLLREATHKHQADDTCRVTLSQHNTKASVNFEAYYSQG